MDHNVFPFLYRYISKQTSHFVRKSRQPNKRQRCANVAGDLLAGEMMGMVAVEAVPHLQLFPEGIVQEFCFFPQPQAMTLRTVEKAFAAGSSQAIRLILIHPDPQYTLAGTLP